MKNKIKIKAAILEKNFKPLKLKDIFFLDELKKKKSIGKNPIFRNLWISNR